MSKRGGAGGKSESDAEAFLWHLRAFGLTPEDVVPSDARGYWQLKEPCPGGSDCRHAYRAAGLICDGGRPLSIRFAQYDRDSRGQFRSPFRYWKRARADRDRARIDDPKAPDQ